MGHNIFYGSIRELFLLTNGSYICIKTIRNLIYWSNGSYIRLWYIRPGSISKYGYYSAGYLWDLHEILDRASELKGSYGINASYFRLMRD